jgi:hypothetical protein
MTSVETEAAASATVAASTTAILRNLSSMTPLPSLCGWDYPHPVLVRVISVVTNRSMRSELGRICHTQSNIRHENERRTL